MHQAIGVMQEALYSSPEATSELLRTARIDPLLRRLKPELDSLWAFNRDCFGMSASKPDSRDSSLSMLNGLTDSTGQDERSRLRLHMEFDYVRLYSNAISIRSAQYRLLRRLIVCPPLLQSPADIEAGLLAVL